MSSTDEPLEKRLAALSTSEVSHALDRLGIAG